MDFEQMFGGKFLISRDESWDAETPANRAEFLANGEEWWYYEIKGRCGIVYPYSETHVAVNLPTRAARRLVKLMGPDLVLLQHSDDSKCFKADVKHVSGLVCFIQPKSLRALTKSRKPSSKLIAKKSPVVPGADDRPLSEPQLGGINGWSRMVRLMGTDLMHLAVRKIEADTCLA